MITQCDTARSQHSQSRAHWIYGVIFKASFFLKNMPGLREFTVKRTCFFWNSGQQTAPDICSEPDNASGCFKHLWRIKLFSF